MFITSSLLFPITSLPVLSGVSLTNELLSVELLAPDLFWEESKSRQEGNYAVQFTCYKDHTD